MRKANWTYIDNISDLVSIRKKIIYISERKSKQNKFWSFFKLMRTDSSGVAPLCSDGDTFIDAPDKATILNKQFSLIFIREHGGPMPDKGPSPFPAMPDIE